MPCAAALAVPHTRQVIDTCSARYGMPVLNQIISFKDMAATANTLSNPKDTMMTSTLIFLMRHWLQMLWVYAASYATQMVKLHTIWNRLQQSFVGNSMGKKIFSAYFELAVAFSVGGRSPKPASSVRLGRHVQEETLHYVRLSLCPTAKMRAIFSAVVLRAYRYAAIQTVGILVNSHVISSQIALVRAARMLVTSPWPVSIFPQPEVV